MSLVNILFLLIGILIGFAVTDSVIGIHKDDPEKYDGEYVIYEDPIMDTYTQTVAVTKSNRILKERPYVVLKVVDRTR